MSDVLRGLWNTTKYSTGEQIAVKPLRSLPAIYSASRVHSKSKTPPPTTHPKKMLMKTYSGEHTLRTPAPQTSLLPTQVVAARSISKMNHQH